MKKTKNSIERVIPTSQERIIPLKTSNAKSNNQQFSEALMRTYNKSLVCTN